MAIRVNHPWLYNYLQLPFYTGDRFKFLPFNMYPGHRGYGAVGGSQGILPQNMLQQFVPLLNSLFGNIKFGSESKETSDQSAPSGNQTVPSDSESLQIFGIKIPKDTNILLHPLSYHPMLSGAALGGLLGSIYLTSKHKKKYKSLGERLTSPEMFYGLAAGGLSGAALGAAIHNYAKFMRGE